MIEYCLAPAEIQEGDLLAYVEGEASPAVAHHIARCPVCATEVESLRQMENLFAQALSVPDFHTPTEAPPHQSANTPKLRLSWQPLLAFSLLLIVIGLFSVFYVSGQAISSEPSSSPVVAERTTEAAAILEEAARPDSNGLLLAKQATYEIPFMSGGKAKNAPPPGHIDKYPFTQHRLIDVFIAKRIIVEENFEIAPPLGLRRGLAQKPQTETLSFFVRATTADFRSKSTIADTIGNRYVVEVDNYHGSATLYFTASIDRGRTWRPDTKIYSGVGRVFNPRLVIDDAQNLYVVWQNWRNIDRYVFYFAHSTDGGRTWSEAVRIDDTSNKTIDPQLTIDADGVLFVTWQKRRSLNTGVYATRSTDGGQTWSDGVRVINIGS